ncbi:MAG TPA: transposase [Xanthobacteraceae bacterium]|jgi:transposase|nr:transposase [Xanthobacteraceae bacterium]
MSGSSTGASLEPVRRIEVFTGEGRRRKWSVSEKMAIVAEMAGGDNISEVARRHGLRPSQLFTWRRELRYAAEAAAAPAFVPAVIERAAAAAPERASSLVKRRRSRRSLRTTAAVEIDIDGVSVKIARGADAQVIAAVIEALKMAR